MPGGFLVGSAYVELGADLGRLTSGLNQARRQTASMAGDIEKTATASTNKLGLAFGTIGKVAGGIALGGVAALGVGLGVATRSAMTFERTMSGVKAVSGATAQEMEQLSRLALQLGKDTAFSASEAAAGIEELVKGGLTIPDIMNGAAQATLDLATAGGVELTEAAEIASNAMGIFGLKGGDMANVANQIAGAANASSLSVTDFQYSMAAAGSVAAGVGQDFDDLATAIAVMGKNGLKGSDAGTSLKTMLMNLQPTTAKSIAQFEELGLYTVDETRLMDDMTKSLKRSELGQKLLTKAHSDGIVTAEEIYKAFQKITPALNDVDFQKFAYDAGATTNAFVDANGQFKSMAEIAGILQEKTAGMSDAQRALALETMFGSDAIRAGNIFVKEGAAGFADMAANMGKVTAASVGAERLNNLSGDVEQLKGSAETAAIALGTTFTPALRDLAQAGTGAVNAAIPLIEAWGPKLATAMSEGLGWLTGTALPALQTGWTWVIANSDLVVAAVAGVGTVFAGLKIVGVITAIVGAWGALSTAIVGAGSVLGGIVAVLGGPVTLAIVGIGLAVAGLTYAWRQNWGGIQEKTAAVWGWLKDTVWAWFQRTAFPWLHDVALPALGKAWAFVWGDIKTATNTTVGWIMHTAWPWLRDTFAHMEKGIVKLRDEWDAAFALIRGFVQALVDRWNTSVETISGGIDTVNKAVDGTRAVWDTGFEKIRGYISTTQGHLTTAWGVIGTAFSDAKTWVREFRESFENITGPVALAVGKIRDSIMNILPDWVKSLLGIGGTGAGTPSTAAVGARTRGGRGQPGDPLLTDRAVDQVVPGGIQTDTWSAWRDYNNNNKRDPGEIHKGVDIGGNAGQNVIATRSGRVKSAAPNQWGGTAVEIVDAEGNTWYFGHLRDDVDVAAGQMVEAGQVIGQISEIYRHVHLQLTDAMGAVIDPTTELEKMAAMGTGSGPGVMFTDMMRRGFTFPGRGDQGGYNSGNILKERLAAEAQQLGPVIGSSIADALRAIMPARGVVPPTGGIAGGRDVRERIAAGAIDLSPTGPVGTAAAGIAEVVTTGGRNAGAAWPVAFMEGMQANQAQLIADWTDYLDTIRRLVIWPWFEKIEGKAAMSGRWAAGEFAAGFEAGWRAEMPQINMPAAPGMPAAPIGSSTAPDGGLPPSGPPPVTINFNAPVYDRRDVIDTVGELRAQGFI